MMDKARLTELVNKCLRALSYDDILNLEYEIERQYKIKQGYDKMGFNWAYTDDDRHNIRFLREEAVEWILLLESIPIIREDEREKTHLVIALFYLILTFNLILKI